jgi:hypothetical protein
MAKLTAVALHADVDVDLDYDVDLDVDVDVEVDHLDAAANLKAANLQTANLQTANLQTTVAQSTEKGTGRVTRLAELRLAGLIRQASEPVGRVEQSLPVSAPLRPLLPGGALRRGGTVAIAATPGATSLLFALVAEASAAGSWCAAVGLPRLGLVAAVEAGVAVERFALVPYPGPDWAAVVAALIDGVDVVVVATPGSVAAPVASRLTARARQRGAVLVPVGQWPGADLTLAVTGTTWHGLGQGRGRLRSHELEVYVQGRGAAARGRRATLWLPDAPARELAERPLAPARELAERPLAPAREFESELGLAG